LRARYPLQRNVRPRSDLERSNNAATELTDRVRVDLDQGYSRRLAVRCLGDKHRRQSKRELGKFDCGSCCGRCCDRLNRRTDLCVRSERQDGVNVSVRNIECDRFGNFETKRVRALGRDGEARLRRCAELSKCGKPGRCEPFDRQRRYGLTVSKEHDRPCSPELGKAPVDRHMVLVAKQLEIDPRNVFSHCGMPKPHPATQVQNKAINTLIPFGFRSDLHSMIPSFGSESSKIPVDGMRL
jgi:hypothetical protein